MPRPLQRRWRTAPEAVLGRFFFARFFDNEHVAPGAESRTSVVLALAILAAPGIALPLLLYPEYGMLRGEPLLHLFWTHRALSVTLSMVIMGGLAVLEWDALFPDRRDFLVLRPLPVGTRAIFTGKLAALIAFVLLFVVALDVVPALLAPVALELGRIERTTAGGTILAHGIATAMAALFGFTAVAGVEGLLLTVLPGRVFRRVAGYVQSAFVCALLLLLFLLPQWAGALAEADRAGAAPPGWCPAAWFVALYESLQRGPNPALAGLQRRAVMATLVAVAAFGVSYAVSYRRFIAHTIELAIAPVAAPGPLARGLRGVLHRTLLRRPTGRATFWFAAATILRSARHRLHVAAFTGIGIAVAVQYLLAATATPRRPDAEALPPPALLAVGPALVFFTVSGLRFAATMPAELRANWIFRVSPIADPRPLARATRMVAATFGVLPFTLAPLPIYAFFWGPALAARHSAFTLACGLLLVDIALAGFGRVPFTAPYVPGRLRPGVLFPAYFFAFTLYTYELARAEVLLFRAGLMDAVLAALAAVLAVAALCRRTRAEVRPLSFEDGPEPHIRRLGL